MHSKPHRQWQCSVCFAHFSRMEHLRRHLKSHDNERSYACYLCRRTFTRKDAMKRHEKTCKAQPSPIDPLSTPDYNDQREHDKYHVEALFQGTPKDEVDDIQSLPEIPSPLDFTALDRLYSQELPPDSIVLAGKLEFLAYFTSARGMAAFLDQDTLQRRQKMHLEYETQIDICGSDCEEKSRGYVSYSGKLYTLLDPLTNFPATTIDPSMIHLDSEDSDPLFLKTQEIVHQFQAIIGTKSDKSIIKLDWDLSVQESCSILFVPQNIRRFLEYFWSFWYPNCPIVHRPSFNPQTAPTALLCVMIIIGACLSPHDGDAVLAKMWLDSVEELVFSNEAFQEKPAMGPTPTVLENQIEWQKKRVECMQMTYLVCSLQKREGSMEAQTRIRRYRHATMVTLARDTGLSASHRSLGQKDPSLSWWREFTVEEELIRSLTYVFLIDAALTVLHNSPPRMVVSELQMGIACSEECFQAESATECFTALNNWKETVSWRDRFSVSAVVRKICQSSLDDHLVYEFSRLGTLNLFTIVQSLHSLTFNLQNSIIFESTFTPVQTGLENWRRIWNVRVPEDRYMPEHPQTIWKKIGFLRYAPEFWHLARIIVARIQSESLDEQKLAPRSPVELFRYDHTDMLDVNGLIMEYRRLNLNSSTPT